jgi:hypothetical protein
VYQKSFFFANVLSFWQKKSFDIKNDKFLLRKSQIYFDIYQFLSLHLNEPNQTFKHLSFLSIKGTIYLETAKQSGFQESCNILVVV